MVYNSRCTSSIVLSKVFAHSLTFSPDGRYLAATLGGMNGLRVFDRDKDWTAAFRDDEYGGDSYGAAFSPGGRLVTTSYDGLIRRYTFEAVGGRPNFRLEGETIKAPGGNRQFAAGRISPFVGPRWRK